jgi:hypothetical protein
VVRGLRFRVSTRCIFQQVVRGLTKVSTMDHEMQLVNYDKGDVMTPCSVFRSHRELVVTWKCLKALNADFNSKVIGENLVLGAIGGDHAKGALILDGTRSLRAKIMPWDHGRTTLILLRGGACRGQFEVNGHLLNYLVHSSIELE